MIEPLGERGDPRYPVGRFEALPTLEATDRKDFVARLAAFPGELRAAVSEMSASQLDTPYREGGWTGRQVVHHLADSHVNAHVRVRRTLTETRPTLEPYDQAAWAELAEVRTLPVGPSLDILTGIHARLVALLSDLAPADFERPFDHREGYDGTVDTLLQLYAWHGRHHLGHLRLLM